MHFNITFRGGKNCVFINFLSYDDQHFTKSGHSQKNKRIAKKYNATSTGSFSNSFLLPTSD